MDTRELSHKYATAIFSLALDEWLAALNQVKDNLANNSALADKLQNVTLTFGEKQPLLDSILPMNISQHGRNFLYTLLKEGQIGLVGEVLADLERLSKGGPQVQATYVTTATALNNEDKDKFRQKLRAQYGDKLEFVFNVDPAIMGGAIVQIGDKLIDGSVATRLNAIGNVLGVKS